MVLTTFKKEICIYLFCLAVVYGQCVDGPHKHIQTSQKTETEISPKVFEYSEFLRQQRVVNHAPTKLSFSEKGTFKIAVFTDLHYGEGEVILLLQT